MKNAQLVTKEFTHFFLNCLTPIQKGFIIGLISFSSTLQGQSLASKKWGVGLEVGPNVTFLDRFAPYDHRFKNAKEATKFGLCLGAYGFYHVHPYVRLQLGLQYMGYGTKFSYSDYPSQDNDYDPDFYTDVYRMNFAEASFSTKLFALPYEAFSPYLLLGTSVGSLLGANEQYTVFSARKAHTYTYDVSSMCQGMLWNYVGGIGGEFLTKANISLGMDAKFISSITTVFNGSNANGTHLGTFSGVSGSHYHTIALTLHASKVF